MTTRHEIKIVDAKPFPPGSFAQEGMPITMLVGTDSYAGVVQSVSGDRRKITVTVGKKDYELSMRTDGNYWIKGKPIGDARRFRIGYALTELDPLGALAALSDVTRQIRKCHQMMMEVREENAQLRAKIVQLTEELSERAWMP